jgi:hypothetical protein
MVQADVELTSWTVVRLLLDPESVVPRLLPALYHVIPNHV